MKALIINEQKQSLGHCSFGQASSLLSDGQARVYKFYPYTLMLKHTAVGEHIAFIPTSPQPSFSQEQQYV